MDAVKSADYPGAHPLRDNRGMDKVGRVTTLAELRAGGNADLRYWLTRSPADCIAAVETLRREFAASTGSVDVESRLQRVCRVTRRERR